jgi:hypothetical protein
MRQDMREIDVSDKVTTDIIHNKKTCCANPKQIETRA